MKKIGGHGNEYGSTGFREETDLSMRLLDAGYVLFCDPQAVAWHMIATGVNREDNGQVYSEKVRSNDAVFREKMKPIYESLEKKGVIK